METDEESNMRIFARRYMVFSAYFMSYSIIIAGSIVILIFIGYFTNPVVAFILFGIICLAVIIGLIRRKRVLETVNQVRQIQAHAKEVTRAEVIGSAVHVAGHPALEREQPVVLALKGEMLSIYSYQSQEALDEIPVCEIQAARTVVYDEDRIPHVEVIDNTAQALQIEFRNQGKIWTCLFRRMKKTRPIDWHHAIQQARYHSGSVMEK